MRQGWTNGTSPSFQHTHLEVQTELGVSFFFHILWLGEVQAREAKMLAHLGFNHVAWWPVTFKSRRNFIKDFSCWTIALGSSTQCLKYFGSLSLLTSMKDVLTLSELHSSAKNESIADMNFLLTICQTACPSLNTSRSPPDNCVSTTLGMRKLREWNFLRVTEMRWWSWDPDLRVGFKSHDLNHDCFFLFSCSYWRGKEQT